MVPVQPCWRFPCEPCHLRWLTWLVSQNLCRELYPRSAAASHLIAQICSRAGTCQVFLQVGQDVVGADVMIFSPDFEILVQVTGVVSRFLVQ